MALKTGDAVYVIPDIDTGQVRAPHPSTSDHDVFCDTPQTIIRFPEASLQPLPYKERCGRRWLLDYQKSYD